MAKRILLIDDDPLLRRSLAFSLERAGYSAVTASTAEDGLALARREPPDLVMLDIGLPGMDGLQALRAFQTLSCVPVIFLTARRRGVDEVLGLEMGAADYISKPFDTDVLLARIRNVLRRTQEAAPAPSSVRVGDLQIDPLCREVRVAGQPVELPPRAFDLLYVLALEPGRVMPADELLARVWGADYTGEPQVIYVHMRWLREKLEADPNRPRRVITVHRAGYKLVPQGLAAPAPEPEPRPEE